MTQIPAASNLVVGGGGSFGIAREQYSPPILGSVPLGMPPDLATPGEAAGVGLVELGRAAAVLGERLANAQRTRKVTELQASFTNDIFDAQRKAEEADPSQGVDIYDAEVEAMQERLDDIDDPIVKAQASDVLTRLSTAGRIAVRRDMIVREAEAARVAVGALETQHLLAISRGDMSADSAIKLVTAAIDRYDTSIVSPENRQSLINAFGKQAVQEEYAYYRMTDAALAGGLMDSAEAAQYLSPDERAAKRKLADDDLEKHYELQAEVKFDEARAAIDGQLQQSTVAADDFKQLVSDITADLVMSTPGFAQRGVFASRKIATQDDLKMYLLDDQLTLAALKGDRERFDAVTGALPKNERAGIMVEKARNTLDAALRVNNGVTEFQGKRALVVQQFSDLMDNAATLGGAPVIPSSIEIAMSDGTTRTVTREFIVGQVVDRKMASIAAAYPADPNKMMAAQMEYLSRNGVTFDTYSRVMEAGYSVTATDIGTIIEGGPDKLPANLDNGFDLWKRMGAMNPRMRDMHVRDELARKFYGAAEMFERYYPPHDAKTSLFMAAKAFGRTTPFPDPLANTITRAEFEGNMQTAFKNGFWFFGMTNRDVPTNKTEIAGKVEQLARFNMTVLGLDPATAVSEASRRVDETHRVLNGWAIDVSGQDHVPDNLDVLSDIIASRYVAKHGATEGVSAGDLVLVPGETSSSWMLLNKRANWPVEQWRSDGMFTNVDLQRLEQERIGEHQEDIVRNFQTNRGWVEFKQSIMGGGRKPSALNSYAPPLPLGPRLADPKRDDPYAELVTPRTGTLWKQYHQGGK